MCIYIYIYIARLERGITFSCRKRAPNGDMDKLSTLNPQQKGLSWSNHDQAQRWWDKSLSKPWNILKISQVWQSLAERSAPVPALPSLTRIKALVLMVLPLFRMVKTWRTRPQVTSTSSGRKLLNLRPMYMRHILKRYTYVCYVRMCI